MYLCSMDGEQREVYNIKDDPAERHNLIGSRPGQERMLSRMLSEWIVLCESGKLGAAREEAVSMDRQTEELLKSLGYLQGTP
jgi:hypothetical protein